MEEFKVNEYITLKLEDGKTNIYVGGKLFNQCKYVLLRKTVYELKDFLENIESIDELADQMDHSLEEDLEFPPSKEIEPEIIDIPVETRFWVHCSNLQTWAENNYDTRLLHSNLSFPLLERLIELGDILAKKIFKKEIMLRYSSGTPEIQSFLKDMGYMDDFTKDDIIQLSLCDEHYEILKEIADESGKEIYSLFHTLGYRNKKIVRLTLGIIEYLPKSLLKLKNSLENLDIHTHLKELPDWIGEFKELKKLSIEDTLITKLPESIGKLKALKELIIFHASLKILPEFIGELKSLEKLDLRANRLIKLPESFSKLSQLKYLSIDDNEFYKIPNPIRGLVKLESLGLVRNSLREIQEWVFKLPSLRKIRVSQELKERNFKYSPKLKYI